MLQQRRRIRVEAKATRLLLSIFAIVLKYGLLRDLYAGLHWVVVRLPIDIDQWQRTVDDELGPVPQALPLGLLHRRLCVGALLLAGLGLYQGHVVRVVLRVSGGAVVRLLQHLVCELGAFVERAVHVLDGLA